MVGSSRSGQAPCVRGVSVAFLQVARRQNVNEKRPAAARYVGGRGERAISRGHAERFDADPVPSICVLFSGAVGSLRASTVKKDQDAKQYDRSAHIVYPPACALKRILS